MNRALEKLLNDRRIALGVLIVIAVIAMSLMSPYFLKVGNLLSLLQYSAVVGILALGQTLVILGGGGGIDLSIGATMSLTSVIYGSVAVKLGWSPWIAVVVAIGAGALLGAFNGILITRLKLPPLIVTLGTQYLFASAALVISRGVDISGFDRQGFRVLGQTSVAGIPFQVLVILIPLYIAVGLVMSRTIFGRNVYAVGSNAVASNLSGVDVVGTRVRLYMISGMTAAVGAVISASWLLNAKAAVGTGMELQAITIAVLGGTAITGGIGRVSGTFLALILVAILNNGMQLADVGNTYQIGLLGVVLVISMLVRPKSSVPTEAI